VEHRESNGYQTPLALTPRHIELPSVKKRARLLEDVDENAAVRIEQVRKRGLPPLLATAAASRSS